MDSGSSSFKMILFGFPVPKSLPPKAENRFVMDGNSPRNIDDVIYVAEMLMATINMALQSLESGKKIP